MRRSSGEMFARLPRPLVLLAVLTALCGCRAASRSFVVENDQFFKDGQPFQLISGSIHYSRVPPQYWRDRLMRLRALGLNAIQTYVPWNFHEPEPGLVDFAHWRNISAFLDAAKEQDLVVLLRPGPYICAEWDFGGLPAWLMSEQVSGSDQKLEGKMQLRSSDPRYLKYVEAWWTVLFKEVAHHAYARGGPVVAVQVENEYGYFGRKDPEYLRFLAKLARQGLGEELLLYTTDGAYSGALDQGTLPNDEVLTVVDFGPGTDVAAAFDLQRKYNAPGKSAPFCSEYYSGWLTHWGERMANTSTQQMADTLATILAYANNTGSVNLYMGHGGTNFGFWAGANIVPAPSLACGGATEGPSSQQAAAWAMKYGGGVPPVPLCGGTGDLQYRGHITSYDYDCAIGEAGTSGQLGIGGEDKVAAVRDVIQRHRRSTGQGMPDVQAPPEPDLAAYGSVRLEEHVSLLDAVSDLVPGGGVVRDPWPRPMEEYNQSFGLILYEAEVTQAGGRLLFMAHDYVKVMLDGEVIATWWRNKPEPVQLPQGSQEDTATLPGRLLQIVVEAMGRDNFGTDFGDDRKGLLGNVTLDGRPLGPWKVYPLPLSNVPRSLTWRQALLHRSADGLATSRRLTFEAPAAHPSAEPCGGPIFYRGVLDVPSGHTAVDGRPPDTFLRLDGWSKGYVWLNGHNLGRYWQPRGPQLTLYAPGCWLNSGGNEVVVLELDAAPGELKLESVDSPDFSGGGEQPLWAAAAV